MTERDANALRAEALESLLVEKGLVRAKNRSSTSRS